MFILRVPLFFAFHVVSQCLRIASPQIGNHFVGTIIIIIIISSISISIRGRGRAIDTNLPTEGIKEVVSEESH